MTLALDNATEGLRAADHAAAAGRFALLGHPNTGRTSLFNRLCGLRAKTANFPGTTTEVRVGRCAAGGHGVSVADLPGTYGLGLDVPESCICGEYLRRGLRGDDAPEALLLVLDGSCLARHLPLVAEAAARDLPTVVVVNKIDAARRRGLAVDVERLSSLLGCPVVATSARTGEGMDALRAALAAPAPLDPGVRSGPPQAWARRVADACTRRAAVSPAVGAVTDRLDAVFTHPAGGPLAFAAVLAGLFFAVFSLAQLPMDMIELLFTRLGDSVSAVLPAGAVRDLVTDGLIAGAAGVLVFLPQIFLLFFLISLLEDSGYLARAAFVADRVLRRVGLPGQAFVPLLTAHACAIPAIMSARLVPDPRDRLSTILVAPFMSCSARLPVYVLLIGCLLPGRPLLAGAAFAGCYALGAAAAVVTAWLLRRTVLPGRARPMLLELPEYRLPSLRTAAVTAVDRAGAFIRNAGTTILAICVVLWWLSAYPVPATPPHATPAAAAVATPAEPDAAAARDALAHSFIGRLGGAVEPVFRPLGWDWQVSIGVLSSFAAREVFVSSMMIVTAAGDDPADRRLLERLRTARRDDGAPVFDAPTAASLLVFYVLAMQCLPTLAVTRRQAGGWRWAALQFGYMFALAYAAALGTRLLVAGLS